MLFKQLLNYQQLPPLIDMENTVFMNEALRLAKEAAEEGEVPVGAVITIGDKIIGRGRNRRESDKNALCHAEIEAINEACKRLGGWRLWECELYVTLEPCPMCAGAIINSRIKKVVFGAHDKKNGACGSVVNLFTADFSFKPQYIGGFMEKECSGILTDFFKTLRKKENKSIKNTKENKSMERIDSFNVDHTKLLRGMYISRIDGNVVTYDIRTRRPNVEEVMENGAIHTLEHLFATYVRNSALKDNIIYFGPMGCRTGFYFLTTGITHADALKLTQEALDFIAKFEGDVPGVSAIECGNYRDHDLDGAKKEAADQLEVLKSWTTADMIY
jgi:tRNA(Arg) A34 adenosine deaminase TadA/S-ribosylhomocysteine lyase LuxS involved in autoinducer biosynthesis